MALIQAAAAHSDMHLLFSRPRFEQSYLQPARSCPSYDCAVKGMYVRYTSRNLELKVYPKNLGQQEYMVYFVMSLLLEQQGV